MSLVEENWQTTRLTIRERAKFVFNNDRFSDIKFTVWKVDGESEGKQTIPAHKFVLSISSPVFEAMFYGELAETKDSIELPDCEYESLLELFRYLYSDEVNLSGSTVMGVLYLAKKYMVPSLAEKCAEYLLKSLDLSNVFSILPSAQIYEEKDLVERCWKVIDEKAEEVVESDGFATIERSLLGSIVVRDTLAIEEIDLFKAVDMWATKQCERQGLEADGETKRRILGEQTVTAIRFPTMSQEDFMNVVLLTDILTKAEIASVARHVSFNSKFPAVFPETTRSGSAGKIQRCCRFNSPPRSTWAYKGRPDVIDFSTDRDITLCGLCLNRKEDST
ncbi:BTB/POZ domain-containing protein 6-like [Stylophora pistillata]|nr:BTB/POZ domain-containing protein 6-like [Stylophora pistillata]